MQRRYHFVCQLGPKPIPRLNTPKDKEENLGEYSSFDNLAISTHFRQNDTESLRYIVECNIFSCLKLDYTFLTGFRRIITF